MDEQKLKDLIQEVVQKAIAEALEPIITKFQEQIDAVSFRLNHTHSLVSDVAEIVHLLVDIAERFRKAENRVYAAYVLGLSTNPNAVMSRAVRDRVIDQFTDQQRATDDKESKPEELSNWG